MCSIYGYQLAVNHCTATLAQNDSESESLCICYLRMNNLYLQVQKVLQVSTLFQNNAIKLAHLGWCNGVVGFKYFSNILRDGDLFISCKDKVFHL